VVGAVPGKAIRSNVRFSLSDRLEEDLDHKRLPAGKGSVMTTWHSPDMMTAIKNRIVRVKAALNCLAYTLIIAMARVNGGPKFQSYRDGRGLKKTYSRSLESFLC